MYSMQDKISKAMADYMRETGKYPNEVMLGLNTYKQLFNELNMYGDKVDEVKTYNGATISIYKGMLDGIVPVYNPPSKDLNELEKTRLVTMLMTLSDEELDEVKKNVEKNRGEMDRDINYLHNELLFEEYYKKYKGED